LAELFAATIVQHQSGAIAEAERGYRQIIALFPDFAEAHSRLGALLMAQGKAPEAICHIEHALALRPDMFEALGNLTQAYMLAGQPGRAIGPASRTLELTETPQTRKLFAHCLGAARFTEDNGRIRGIALRALSEGWGRPRTLTGACVSALTERMSGVFTNRPALVPALVRAVRNEYLKCAAERCTPSVDELARRLNLSGRTLRRRMAKLGINCQSVIDDSRSCLSQELLRNSALSIDEVAGRLGFSDEASFRKAFKRWTDLTPAEYRCQVRARTQLRR